MAGSADSLMAIANDYLNNSDYRQAVQAFGTAGELAIKEYASKAGLTLVSLRGCCKFVGRVLCDYYGFGTDGFNAIANGWAFISMVEDELRHFGEDDSVNELAAIAHKEAVQGMINVLKQTDVNVLKIDQYYNENFA